MTKDRARKQATRQRAAATGERYVVAQRAGAEPQPRKAGRMDALTHRVPGVPAHIEGGLQGAKATGRTSKPVQQKPVQQNPHHIQPKHDEPRVLVGWQTRIARLFGAK